MNKWRPPGLSELTPITINTELTHLGSEASKYSLTDNISTIINELKLCYFVLLASKFGYYLNNIKTTQQNDFLLKKIIPIKYLKFLNSFQNYKLDN